MIADQPTLAAPAVSQGIVGKAVTGGQQPCPPYIIIGVYHPNEAIKANGCYFKSGVRGVIVVPFFKTQSEVSLTTGQMIRFAPGHGYYAYPPSG